MTDLNFEYWDDYVNPKPGQISIVDALRWRDDVFFINHDRLSGLKPSMKKRIREDLNEGKQPFAVLFEPPQKVVVGEINIKDIPLPGEEPKRLYNSSNMPDDFVVPLPQEEPKTIRMFNREPNRVFMYRNPNIDIPLSDEPHKENGDSFDSSTCASDSGFSERIESLYSGKITEKLLQTADFNFSRETSTNQTVFTFGLSHSPQNQLITTESLGNDINNNPDGKTDSTLSDLYLSEREDGELSDSDMSEIEIDFGSKRENRDLSVIVKDVEMSVDDGRNGADICKPAIDLNEVYLSDYEETEFEIILEKTNDSCPDGKTDSTNLYLSEKEDGELSDSDVSEIEINFGSKRELNGDICKPAIDLDEVYLSDYDETEFEIILEETNDSCTSDAKINKPSEKPCPKSGLSDLETDLASLIEKLEQFHLENDGGETHKLVEMMTELKIKAETFNLPTDVIGMLEGLNLDPKSKEEASLLAKELAKMTISLKQDVKKVN